MSNLVTRRAFLRSSAAASATAVAVVTPVVVEAMEPADLTAIPTDIVDNIKAWQAAHREAVRATNAYSASLRVKPIDKRECDRCFHAMVAANEVVGPAREAMIMALWRVT